MVASVDLELAQRQQQPDNRHIDDKIEYAGPKCWGYFMSHWPDISTTIALLAIGIITWTLAWILMPMVWTIDSVPTRMTCLFVGAQICGIFLRILQWPEMLGMLGFGVVFANIGFANFDGYNGVEVFCRDLALVNIMLLAGMGIDLKALIQRIWRVALLSVVPTIGEVLTIALIAAYVLQMPLLWSILLGLVITAVSPNVVIDIVIWLGGEKLGQYNGIHTIIIAMTTFNDVLSIFFFNVFLGIIFTTGTLKEQLLQGPVGVAIGIVYGFVSGLIVSKLLPSKKSKYANGLRSTAMVVSGLLSVIGSKAIGFPSAGALGCATMACVCARTWRKPQHAKNNDVRDKLNLLWKFVKPISFALIGKEVLFAKLDLEIVGYGAVIVTAGSCCRLMLAYLSLWRSDLNRKERSYITISSFPKATVQAALAPMALDIVRKQNLSDLYGLANTVLIVSVLAIILTAPLGAILMVKLAPIFLRRGQSTSESN